eukprot:gb/GEZN01028928.1/.p1 GENE.gb/GEZN01028928.1/~~gb/GEZN01028928.1/.p1  ORF type:complete len:144 (+),score=12.18 gb/GEZN01028928.1/:29-433(+)
MSLGTLMAALSMFGPQGDNGNGKKLCCNNMHALRIRCCCRQLARLLTMPFSSGGTRRNRVQPTENGNSNATTLQPGISSNGEIEGPLPAAQVADFRSSVAEGVTTASDGRTSPSTAGPVAVHGYGSKDVDKREF